MSSFAIAFRLSAYTGALFLTLGSFLPFWPVFLESRGLTAAQIGVVLAVMSWARVIGVPLWGRIADPPGRGRPTLVLLALASALFYGAFFFVEGYLPALVTHLLIGLVFGALIPLGDSQILQARRDAGPNAREIDYGRVRLWGSATFILGNLLGGWLIAEGDPNWYLASVVAPLIATAAAAWSLPRRSAERGPYVRLPVRSLLRNQAYLVMVLVSCLLQASHGAFYVVSALAWRAAGYSDGAIAWLWIEGVVAEILLLAYGKHLQRRFSPVTLLAIGGTAAVVRWSLTAASTDMGVLVIAQSLHAFSFAIVHLASVTEIARVVPPATLASAQSLLTAVHAGLFMSLSIALAGWLYDEQGAGAAFGAMAVLGLAGLAALFLLHRKLERPQAVP